MPAPVPNASLPAEDRGAGPSNEPETPATAEGDEELLATVDEGELVQMVPCTLLDGAELVELHGAGEHASGGPYLALDASVGVNTAATPGLYYYASYGGEIDALDPTGAQPAVMYAAPAGAIDPNHATFLANVDGQTTTDCNTSAVAAEAGRPESPEEKKTPKEKTIARVVMAVACTLLTLCIILVGVTLSMSEHINRMVRQIHGGTKAEESGTLFNLGRNSTTKHPLSYSSR